MALAIDGPVPLRPDHVLAGFVCRSADQTTWLQRAAARAHEAGTSRVYVVTEPGSLEVIGYYALAAASVSRDNATSAVLKGAGRYPDVPATLLARLGVHEHHERTGIGKLLVAHAIAMTLTAADYVGSRCLLIHAETPEAKAFYQHIAEFEESPSDELHLIALMQDLRAAKAG